MKPRFEKNTSQLLRDKGFEEFLPLYRARRHWRHRTATLHLPLFPGYLFCRFVSEHRMPVLCTPGVFDVVGFGRKPAAVPDSEIEAIRRVVQCGLEAEPVPFLAVGQKVRVEGGPLFGVEGIVVSARNAQRLVLSVSLLQRSVAVEISRDWVIPIPQYLRAAG